MKTFRNVVRIFIFAIVLGACTSGSPVDQPNLEESTWVLVKFNQNSPIESTQTTITFEGSQVSGNAGCNTYGGSYQVEGDTISFSGLFATEMYCENPEGIMEQESAYLELMGTAQRFELVEGTLTIFTDLEQTMTFHEVSSTAAIKGQIGFTAEE